MIHDLFLIGPFKYILRTLRIYHYAGASLSLGKKKMHLGIMTQRLIMPDSFDLSPYGLFIYRSFRVKGNRDPKAFQEKWCQYLLLKRSRYWKISLSLTVCLYLKIGFLLGKDLRRVQKRLSLSGRIKNHPDAYQCPCWEPGSITFITKSLSEKGFFKTCCRNYVPGMSLTYMFKSASWIKS